MNDIGSSTNPEVTLALTGVSKVFPGVVALDKVDFSLHSHEIVGLVGENQLGDAGHDQGVNQAGQNRKDEQGHQGRSNL